ncbi:MAG TPA: hypothetical protein VFV08_11555 [Puia sp.]|nr:hypothetical protein [Puia sp.]
MSILRVLSKMAFICNICFMFAMSILWMKQPPNGEIISLIIVLGYVLSIVINLIVNLWYSILLALKKQPGNHIPAWLTIVNFLFLIVQLIIILR